MSAKEFTYGLNLQVKGAEQVGAAQRLLDQFYAVLQKGSTLITTSAQGMSRGFQEVANSTQKLSQSSNTLNQSMNQQKSAFTTVQQGLTQYKGATDQTVQSQTRLGQATQQLQQHFNNEKTALTGASQSAQQLRTTTDQMATSQAKVSTSLQQSNTILANYKTTQQQAVTGTTQLNAATEKTVTTMDRLKGSFSTLTLGVTTLTTGVFSLYNTYDSLNDVQLKLETMRIKEEASVKKAAEAQRKYNEMLKDGKSTQVELDNQLKQVEITRDRAALATAKLTDAQEDLDRAWKDFAINTIPAAIQTLGGGAAAIASFGKAMKGSGQAAAESSDEIVGLTDTAASYATITSGGISASDKFTGALRRGKTEISSTRTEFQNLSPALSRASVGMQQVGGATVVAGTAGSRLLPILGGIGAAIAVVGGALVATNQNWLGFRDILNNVGEAIGTAVPAFEGILELIKGFAGQIGLSGEATEEWQDAMSRGLETVGEQWEQIKAVAIPILSAVEEGLNQWGFAVEKVVQNYQDMANSTAKFIGDIQRGWDSLVSGAQSLGAQIKTAIDTGLAFLTNPATYTKAFDGLLTSAVEAGQNAVNILTSIIGKIGAFVFGSDVWGNLTKGAVEAAQNSVKIIQSVLGGVASWFDENVVKPISQKIATLPVPTDPNYQKELDYSQRVDTAMGGADRDKIPGAQYNIIQRALDTAGQPSTYTPPPPPQKGPPVTGTAGQAYPAAKPGQVMGYSPPGVGSAPAQQYKDLQMVYAQTTQEAKKLEEAEKKLHTEEGLGTKIRQGLESILGKQKVATGEVAASAGVAAKATGELSKSSQDFIAGYKEQDAVLGKNAETLQKTAGGVTRLKEQLSEGTIQAVAFGQGFKDAEKEFLNTQLTTSKLSGEVAFLSKNLGDAGAIAVRTASGFVQGAKSVYDWAASFDTMKGTVDGSKVALMDVADTMGVTIPRAFQGSVEAMKKFISLTKQAGPEFEAFANQLESTFSSLTSSLPGAIRESNKAVNEEIDKMEENMGFEFNEGVRNALKLDAAVVDVDKMGEEFSSMIKNLRLSPDAFDDFRDDTLDKMKETIDDIPEELRGPAEAAFQGVIDAFNAPVDLNDENSIMKYVSNIELAIDNFIRTAKGAGTSVKTDLETINEINFDEAIQQIDSLNNALKTLGSGDAGAGVAAKAVGDAGDISGGGGGGFGIASGSSSGAGGGTGGGSSKSGTSGKDSKKSSKGGGAANLPIDIAAFQANLDEATAAFTDFMTTLFTNAAGIPNGVMAGIQPLVEMFNTQLVAPIVQLAIGTLGPGIALGFEAAKEPSGQALMEIRDGAAGAFTTIISDAQGLGPGIAAGFSAARDQSAPHISGLAEDFASNAVVPIERMASGIAETIGSAFEKGRDRAKTALGDIEEAANLAMSAVQGIATAIENLPDRKVVTIEIQTVGSVPNINASGFEGVVGGRAGGHTFTAGEAGPELVSIIPLSRPFTGPGAPRGGNTPNPGGHTFAAEGFQGLVGGSVDSATYLHGSLAGQTPNSVVINDVNIAMVGGRPISAVGGVLGGIPVSIVSGNSGFITNNGITGGFGQPTGGGGGTGGTGTGGGTGGGSSVLRQVDVNENGVHYYYYQNGNDIRTNMSDAQIAKYVGPGAGSGSGSPTTPNTPPGTGGGSGSGGGGSGGYVQPDYVQTTGGSKWTTNPQGELNIVSMTDASHQGEFKVVDSQGKNVAANFKSEAEAQAWINNRNNPSGGGGGGISISPGAHPNTSRGPITASSDGKVHTQEGGVYTVESWNRIPDDERVDIAEADYAGIKSIPAGYSLEEDYSLSRISGGGGSQTPGTGSGGGGTGGTGGQTPGTGGGIGGTGGFDFDNQQPGPGEYTTSTGYVVPNDIQTPGHGTTGTSPQWQNPNMDPRTWKATEMTSRGYEGKWKVVDSAGINIAANFRSKAEAEDFIADHITAYYPGGALPQPGTGGGGGGQTPGGGGGGGGSPTTPNNPPTSGGGGGGGSGQGTTRIQVQENGQTYFYERDANGAVRTNMSPAQIAQYVGPNAPGPTTGGTGWGTGTGGTGAGPNIGGQQFPPGFPFENAPKGPGGGPIIGGIEFPPGFPFHNTPGAFPGNGTGGGIGGYPGLLAGMGLPYSMISPRVSTDTSIPTSFSGYSSGSGYVGTEVGAGGRGRNTMIPGGVGVPFGWPFGTGSITTGNPNQGTTTITANGITQTQSWNQSSNIVSNGNIVGQGNNYNYQYQSNTGNNVGGINFPPGFPFGGGGSGTIGGMGNPLGGAQYYDSSVVENTEGTERHPIFRTNMNQAQMARLLAMMTASGQEIPYYTSGEPALTGFRYNAAGWTGSRPVATPRQLRTGRDNHTPIWDVGGVAFPSDFGTYRSNQGISGNIGGGSPFPPGGFDWGGLIDKLTSNIMSALQSALAKVAININLNNSTVGDAATKLMMRRISGGF